MSTWQISYIPMPARHKRTLLLLAGLTVLAAALSQAAGPVVLSPGELWAALMGRSCGTAGTILLHIRLPRTCACLLAGAALVLTRRSVLERPFWELVERERVTSLAGVPYTYRMYRRAGLLEMELPALNTLTQAGGKLPEALHLEFADWAARTGRRFFVMYGQTEAAPRMGYLPAERAVEKCGSMGVPVPGGQFRLDSFY